MESVQFKDYKLYSEDFSVADGYRQAYSDSLYAYIAAKRADSAAMRDAFMPPEAYARDPESFRRRYIQMLGAPLTEYAYSVVPGKEEYVATDDLCRITRVTLEIFPGFHFYGMFMEPTSEIRKDAVGRFPLVICQHGGGGTPELCSDMHGKNNYSHMTRRVLEYGAIVFAPQLYLWNTALYNVPMDRGEVDRELRRYGSSIVGLEIYCIRKAIDYLLAGPFIDPKRIAMNGLSYGGMYTMYTMAAEQRIAAGYTCGCFNDRAEPTVMADLVFSGSGGTFMDAEVAALCAPRALYIDVGKSDTVFNYKTAEAEFSRVPRYFEACGVPENVRFNLWEGGHTVCDRDDGYDFLFDALDKRANDEVRI